MHTAIDSLIDVVIGVIVFSLCIGTFITISNHLLGAPDMGFGRLEDKAQIDTATEYNQYDRFSCVNWYQMATVPLVNDYGEEFYTFAARSTTNIENEDFNNRFTQQYWFKAPNIVKGDSPLIDLNERMMPLGAFTDEQAQLRFAIGATGKVNGITDAKSHLYNLFFYTIDG